MVREKLFSLKKRYFLKDITLFEKRKVRNKFDIITATQSEFDTLHSEFDILNISSCLQLKQFGIMPLLSHQRFVTA